MPRTILVIEDSENIAYLEKRHLEKDGFRVLTASTGKEGLAYLSSQPDIDLLVIDYHLPDMSGVNLMEIIKAMGREIPSIIVTGSGNESIAVKAMKLGALDYIVKDTETIKSLAETCKDALNRYNAERENRRLMAELKTVNTELLEVNKKLEEISKIDELTGAFNRRHLMDTLEFEIWRAKRYRIPLSFAIFDLDHFKDVNDTLGHLAGDMVLKEFAQMLKAEMRRSDIVGRYGGEEFGIILSSTPPDKAFLSCERLRDSVSNRNFGSVQSPIKITTSAGVACLKGDMSLEGLVAEADHGLYEAKRRGRNLVITLQEG